MIKHGKVDKKNDGIVGSERITSHRYIYILSSTSQTRKERFTDTQRERIASVFRQRQHHIRIRPQQQYPSASDDNKSQLQPGIRRLSLSLSRPKLPVAFVRARGAKIRFGATNSSADSSNFGLLFSPRDLIYYSAHSRTARN